MALSRDLLIKELTDHEPVETTAIARTLALFTEGKRRLNLKSPLLFSILEGMTPVVSRKQPTFWVQLDALRLPVLGMNDKFANDLGEQHVDFVLAHELFHLLFKHLYDEEKHTRDSRWIYAQELTINYWVSFFLRSNEGRVREMPVIRNPKTGKDEVAGQDWREGHKKVVKACTELGVEPPTLAEMYATDLDCLEWLRKAKVEPPQQNLCVHMLVGDDGSSSGQSLDPAGLGDLVEDALSRTVQLSRSEGPAAEHAQRELQALQDMAGDSESAARVFGRTGANQARGGASEALKRTEFWRDKVAHKLWERMQEDYRLELVRKRVDDCVLAFRGDSEYSRGGVYTDASASMRDRILSVLAGLVGQTDDLLVDWHSWDGSVKLYTPGDAAWRGGGGTSFDCIVQHLRDGLLDDGSACPCEAPDDEPDWIIIVTDGYAEPTRFDQPEKVVVIITPGGSPAALIASGIDPNDIIVLTDADLADLAAA